MDGKIKIIIAVAAVAAIGMAGYNKLAGDLNQDPPITSLQAEFVGEVKPGQTFTKRMFDVKGVTESGKVVQINDFIQKRKQQLKTVTPVKLKLKHRTSQQQQS